MREGLVKAGVFRALERTGVLGAWESLARGMCILAYHGVTARGGSADDSLTNARRLHVPVARFEEHLRYLSGTGRVIRLSDLEAALDGRTSIEDNSIVITFDDGYRNLATRVGPLLQRYGLPATAFVLTGKAGGRLWPDRIEAAVASSPRTAVRWRGFELDLGSVAGRARAARDLVRALESEADRDAAAEEILPLLDAPDQPDEDRDLLSWDELRTLKALGIDVGSHADVHEPLTRRPAASLERILRRSRERLESELGPAAYPFSFPYGAWNRECRDAVARAGFSSGTTTDPGLNRPGADRFLLRRFLIGADDDRPRLRASVSGLRAIASGRAPSRP